MFQFINPSFNPKIYEVHLLMVELYLFNFLRKCQTNLTLCSDLHQNPLLLKFKQSISRNCILDK
jgi:hypothetical protein